MIVQDAQVSLASQREFLQQTTQSESLRMWAGKRSSGHGWRGRAAFGHHHRSVPTDSVTLSGTEPAAESAEATPAATDGAPADAKVQSRIAMVEKMVESYTGRKVKIRPLKIDRQAHCKTPAHSGPDAGGKTNDAGWGVTYDATASQYEKETVAFQAGGVVKTADGKEIQFALNLQLTREQYEEVSIHLAAGSANRVDPLVINFDGTAAELTDTKFAFDLNADGTQEDISFLQPGSGFLVLDPTGAGQVADGSALFGPTTGNGFAELSQYDADGNGWIDEADPVYNDLRIWTKDSAGADVLNTLAEKDVGAIYLGNVDGTFALKGADGQDNGQLQRLGVWLSESGGAPGVVSEVDLTV
jgi:hypothetical protein